MSKLKTFLAILLTAVIIGTMALLPQAAEKWGDQSKPGTAPIQPVQLTFHQDTSMLRKLVLSQQMSAVPITPDAASMTEEEVLAAAWDGLGIYIDAGIVDPLEPTYQSAEPYLGIDPNDKNNYVIFWSVTIHQENQQSIFLHIDDDTGKILLIIYDHYKGNRAFTESGGHDMMERLIHAYLSPLELLPSQVEWNVGIMETQDGDSMDVVYLYQNTPYGDLQVGFVLTPDRAYVYFVS